MFSCVNFFTLQGNIFNLQERTKWKRSVDFDVHLFVGMFASAVAIEMRQEPCLGMRHLVTTVVLVLLSALSHRIPSWIKSLAGEMRRSLFTAPRLHMVHSYDQSVSLNVCVCVYDRKRRIGLDWV